MENSAIKATPFSTGWRNTVSGTVYRNAGTQTGKNGRRNEKKAQTDWRMEKYTYMEREVGVQANFFPDVRDKFVDSTRKEPCFKDPPDEKILESAVKIQRFYSYAYGFATLTATPLRLRPSEILPRAQTALRTFPTLGSPNPRIPLERVNEESPGRVSQLRGVNSCDEQNLQEHLIKRPLGVARRAHRGRRTTIPTTGVSARAKNTDRRQIQPEQGCYRSRDFVILNRTSPSTRADFELLYNLLDRWRVDETRRANEQLFEPSRIALCSLILSKEVELLRSIDAVKTAARFKKKERSYRKFLDDLCEPVVWENSRGEPMLVETERVQLARCFRDTFEELSKEDQTAKERVEELSKLRKEVEPHTCRESDELVRLLDQEIDLLTRNVTESKLNWLRSRLRMAFLRLARECLRNEREDARLIGWFRSSNKTICRSCGRLLPAEKFPRGERRRCSCCNYCLYARVRNGPRVIYEPYQRLLRDARRNEARMHCYTSPAFVIDAKIVYHLVNDIWHGKSPISENDCLRDLRLVRFRKDQEWSPWNCLLLTDGEAAMHRKVANPENFYGTMILQKFHTKNLQAKLRFQSVAEFDKFQGAKRGY